MKNYMRPEFYVTEFMPDEYIAACNRVTEEKITLTCDCGVQVNSTVASTSATDARINLTDGTVIYLDAESGSDKILVFRTGDIYPNGCKASAYQRDPIMTTGDECMVYNETGILESTYHHHAKVTSVSNFS